MKLRYGDEFGRSSGSTWRLLFVFALMPWLRRYRISSGDSDVFEEALLQQLDLKHTILVSDDGQVKELHEKINYSALIRETKIAQIEESNDAFRSKNESNDRGWVKESNGLLVKESDVAQVEVNN